MGIFYELLGIIITITAFVLPTTLELMSTHFNFYISTIVVLSLALFIKGIIWFREIKGHGKNISGFPKFEYYIFRSFSQEIILYTGMWILMLEARVEEMFSILILVTNILILFITSYYTLIISHYIIFYIFEYKNIMKSIHNGNVLYYDPSSVSKIWEFRFLSLLIFLIFGYQSIVTVNFFLRPLFIMNFETYEEILIPGLVFMYFFIVVVAFLIVGLLLSKEKIIVSSTNKVSNNKGILSNDNNKKGD
jgi:hypothetical protein